MSARRASLILLLATATWLASLTAAGAQTEPWVINAYDVTLTVQDDGDLLVSEQLRIDFGTLQRHGIYRTIPLWEPLPEPLPADAVIPLPDGADPDDYQRELAFDLLDVTSPSGAPADVSLDGPSTASNGNVTIRIGHPDVLVSGRQEYVIRYRIRGGLTAFTDHAELYWDAIGTEWGVPIASATVFVSGPGIQDVACFEGAVFSRATCQSTAGTEEATFSTTGVLAPGEGLTVAVAFSPDAIDVPPPTIVRVPGPVRFLAGNAAAVPLTALLSLLGIGGLATLAWREGRDRVARGTVVAKGWVDPTRADERRRGLFEPRPVPVEFRPPGDMRPALLGLIIDERVDAVDISATIVDLAVRGYLTITEIQQGGWFRRGDWELVRSPDPRDALGGYEGLLLDGLFDGRDRVKVSELRGTFSRTYAKVEGEIYSAGQAHGWFARRPDRARPLWLGAGLVMAALGGAVIALAGSLLDLGLVGVPIVVAGLALAILSPRMPRRTPTGSALLLRTLGFKTYIERAETGRMAFAEAQGIFVEHLPYAVVFGAVDRWAQAFEQIGIDPGEAVSGFYTYTGAWSLMHFSSGMSEFADAVGPAMATAPPSSSGGSGFSGGGFSGGGGGGGGGGSW